GKDSNPGTAAAPFATVASARDAVRGMIKAGLTKDILVEIRGGTYPVTETLTFGPEDSGTEKYSITYAAAPGEKVALSGGRKITGWQKGTNRIWTAVIPEVKEGKWYPRQLFVDGQRAIRARTPNADDKTPSRWTIKTTDGKAGAPNPNSQLITLSVDHPIQAWKNSTDVEFIYFNNNDASRKRVGSVNEASQTFTLPPPHQWPPSISAQAPSHPGPGMGCYFENALEMLDQPGEWYLDRTSGVLSYWPRPGEDLARAEVIAPVVQNTLLAVKGTAQNPVCNLRFKGIRVEQVDWLLPPYGFALMFGCLQVTTEQPKFYWIDAAVCFQYARACSFRDGGVANVGGIGLSLLRGTSQIVIEGNEICNLGGSGIVAGGLRNRDTIPWSDPIGQGEHKGYRIANNHVYQCGLDYFGALGICVALAQEAVIAHNLIHDTAYAGFVMAGNEDPAFPFARDSLIEYNHIHHTMKAVGDGAGFYISSPFAGGRTRARGNLIHDGTEHWAAGGLYLDLKCSGVTFDHNVVYGKQYTTLICDKADLTTNTWTGNLLLSNKDEAPPEEFIEVMRACAGLEPAYRKALQGTDPQPCEVHVLEGSDATRRVTFLNTARNEPWEIQTAEGGTTWQFDLSKEGRGVVYRMNPHATEGKTLALKLQKLDPAARYALKAYSARIEPTLVCIADRKIQAPMVQKIGPAPDLGLPEVMTGRELMEKGLTLKDGMGVVWVAYQSRSAATNTFGVSSSGNASATTAASTQPPVIASLLTARNWVSGAFGEAGGVTNYTDAGGTNWTAHIFRTVGTHTFTVKSGGVVEYLVVGGGGGGGGGACAGGGGGGHVTMGRMILPDSGDYTVLVGDGGAPATVKEPAQPGEYSTFSSIVAYGGEAGTGHGGASAGTVGGVTTTNAGGLRFAVQGNMESQRAGGGGAGSVQDGQPGAAHTGGAGGDGVESSIAGVTCFYGGGGGGGAELRDQKGVVVGAGGKGGGGQGEGNLAQNKDTYGWIPATPGVDGMGGGGGGAGGTWGVAESYAGSRGGSGIVVLRYVRGK
ncbi:MAG: right-handed parallel beta-helix repeat-containing protein, partial [bacterium]